MPVSSRDFEDYCQWKRLGRRCISPFTRHYISRASFATAIISRSVQLSHSAGSIMSFRQGFSRMLKCPIREQKLTRLYRAAIPSFALGHSSLPRYDHVHIRRILDNITRGNVCISRECFRGPALESLHTRLAINDVLYLKNLSTTSSKVCRSEINWSLVNSSKKIKYRY